MELKEKIYNRLRWEWHKSVDKVFRRFVTPPRILSYAACVDYIIAHRASVARMGDGELGVIYGKTLGFQSKDLELGKRLSKVMAIDSDSLLICLPDTFEHLERYNPVEQNFWNAHHYFNRRRWYRHIKKGKIYGNTFLSRFYSMEFDKDLSTKRISLLKRLWDDRDIIFVEGRDTKMGVGNDLFDNARTIRRILCPSKDAFSAYDKIIDGIGSVDHKPNDLYILALGPTATVLAADLHAMGLQALDMGHMDIEFEWYRQGVKKKVPVTGKYSNEALILGLAKDAVSGNLVSDTYQSQIIQDLSH